MSLHVELCNPRPSDLPMMWALSFFTTRFPVEHSRQSYRWCSWSSPTCALKMWSIVWCIVAFFWRSISPTKVYPYTARLFPSTDEGSFVKMKSSYHNLGIGSISLWLASLGDWMVMLPIGIPTLPSFPSGRSFPWRTRLSFSSDSFANLRTL